MDGKALDAVIDDKVKQICYCNDRVKQICLVKQICYTNMSATRNYYICSISIADIVFQLKMRIIIKLFKMLQKQQYSPNNNHYSVS